MGLAADRRPLLLVPGVCGSQLAVRQVGDTGDGERCWVAVRAGPDAAYQKLWGKYRKDSRLVELLLPGLEVCVPQGKDGSGLFPISVLDPDVGVVTKAANYFLPMIKFLQTAGYSPGVDLFGVGYDYRQSCRTSAHTLLERLQQVSEQCGGQKVDLVTHSMGGLVARSLLVDFPAEFEKLVGRWVAIGCPFGGAPGYAVDGLITGVQFGGSLGDFFFVQRGTFRQAACQSPAVYELLPPLDFPFSQPPPQLTLWLKAPIPQQQPPLGAGQPTLQNALHTAYTLHSPATAPALGASFPRGGSHPAAPQLPRISLATDQSATSVGAAFGGTSCPSTGSMFEAHHYVFKHDGLPSLLTQLLKDNTVSVQGASIPLPFDPELWTLAQATHKAWKGAHLPSSCSFFNIIGSGLTTPYDVQYGTWWHALQDLEAVPHSTAAFTTVDGDGTVPAESAQAHGFEESVTVAVKGAHRDLVGMQEVLDQVLTWLQASEPPDQDNIAAVPSACAALLPPHIGTQQSCRMPSAVVGAADGDEFWNPLVWRAMLG